MDDLDTQEPLSNLSDSSFVILGQGSLPSQVDYNVESQESAKSVLTRIYDFPYESTTSSGQSSQSKFLNDSLISEESIQKKLDELVKENYQLKVTLSQNNLAIKSQLDTFFMWQQEVLKTHESHKEKFLETKSLILKLRAENLALKKQIENSSMGVSNNEIYAQVYKKPDDIEKLKEKVEEYEKKYNDLTGERENLSMENEKLKEKLKAAENEIFKLNKELEDLKRDKEYLEQKSDFNKNSLGSVPCKSLNLEAHAQICNLLKQLDEERAKVLQVKEELKKSKSGNTQTSEQKLSTTEELNQYIEKLDDMNLSLDKKSERLNSLQSWVSLAEENLKENKVSTGVECNLMSEIIMLKSHLNQEENVSREKQESLQAMRKEFARLLDDYKTLQSQLNLINNKETDIEKYKEEISSLKAKVEAKDNELKLKQGECDDLKEVIKKVNLECEEVSLLRIQAELYQSDFKEEREAREKLAGEKAEMAEQIRHLQRKIETLEQQKNSETPKSESLKEKNNYACPNCLASIPDFKSLEEHYRECINIDPYL